MNVIDILILGIIFLGAWQGYRKGLLTGLISLGGTIFAIIVASARYQPFLAKVEQHYQVRDLFEPIVYRATAASLQTQSDFWEEKTLSRISELLPAELHSLIPQGQAGAKPISQDIADRLAHELAGTITDWILSILAFAVIFFAVLILVQLLAGILLKPLGIFRGFINHGGGFLFGAAGAVLGLAIVAGLLAPLLELTMGPTGELIQGALFYPYLSNLYLLLAGVLDSWRMVLPLS